MDGGGDFSLHRYYAVGQLEEDPLYFPIIVVDWNITVSARF